MSELPATTQSPAANDGISAPDAESGCPTPLAWQQVVQSVRAASRRLSVDVGPISLSGFVLGTGEPVYLLPGFVGDHELFALTGWLLREDKCCVLLDPPQVRTTQAVELSRCVEALIQIVDRLGHKQIRMHANSFGSLIAIRTMLAHPDRVAAASLHCGFAGWKLTGFERMLTSLGLRSQRPLAEWPSAVRLQTANHQRWFPPFDRSRWDFYLSNVSKTPSLDVARRARLADSHDCRSELGSVNTDVLLIDCEGDGRVTAAAHAGMAERLPRCRTESVDNCGRLLHLTHPHRLVKLLRAFWEETT